MSLHKKKFVFENPEDSYWNQNGGTSDSIFDDLPSKQWAARAAVDTLFEGGDDRQAAVPKLPALKNNLELSSTPLQVRERIVDDFINNRSTLLKGDLEHSSSPRGAPSVISECSASSLPSDANRLDLDYSRLKAEHRKLQQYLETVRHDRFRALDVGEAVRRLLRGAPVSLDFYRSKAEKLRLLEAALETYDSNVIYTVLIFIRSTLNNSIFNEILLTNSEAANWYVRYLKEIHNNHDLATTLFSLGRTTEVAMLEFSEAVRLRDSDQKVSSLRKCCQSSFSDPQLVTEHMFVNDFINLLECQQKTDLVIQNEGRTFDDSNKGKLLGRSANASLHHLLVTSTDKAPVQPTHFRSLLRFTEKEYVWLSICAYVHTSRWPDLERVLSPKNAISRGILSGNRFSCPFAWPNLFYLLHQCGGKDVPKDLLCRLLRSVPDQELRFKMAEKYNVSEIVVEQLVQQRDRSKLASYCSNLTPNSPEAFKALAALNNKGIKWKN